MYAMAIKTCSGARGEVKLPEIEAYQTFATYADLLLMGEDLNVGVPDATEGDHSVQVSLLHYHELTDKPTLISSVYLLCPHDVEVDETKTAKSKLYTPAGVR